MENAITRLAHLHHRVGSTKSILNHTKLHMLEGIIHGWIEQEHEQTGLVFGTGDVQQ